MPPASRRSLSRGGGDGRSGAYARKRGSGLAEAEIGRRLRIFGHVQGVFFRAWTQQQAQKLGVTGLVRNRRDGSVEVEAFGDADAVEALTARCREGPTHACVERVDVEELEGQAPPAFRVAPTV